MPLPRHSSSNSRAIAILVSGDQYAAAFHQYFRPSIAQYAQKYGYDLIVLTEAELTEAMGRPLPIAPPAWFKIYLGQQAFAAGYEQVLLLDADVFISSSAQDVFAACPAEKIGGCFDCGVRPEKIASWYERGGAPSSLARMLNTGVLAFYRSALPILNQAAERADQHLGPTHFSNRLYEQPLLSHAILTSDCFHELPASFNRVVSQARETEAPGFHRLRITLNNLVSKYPILKRCRPALYGMLFHLPGSKYRRVHEDMIRRLLPENHFLHLADMWDERIILSNIRGAS